ncbi:hypothetical protein [Terrabacter sp. C0L_2]|nr:hypothetical protein U5C87_03245 [Terrabacter sp. C0L_2]
MILRLIARPLRHGDTAGAISRAIRRTTWCLRLVVGSEHDH